jgi:hypothetical protein
MSKQAAIPSDRPNMLISEKTLFFQRFRQAVLK